MITSLLIFSFKSIFISKSNQNEEKFFEYQLTLQNLNTIIKEIKTKIPQVNEILKTIEITILFCLKSLFYLDLL